MGLVRVKGLEPPLPYGKQILSLVQSVAVGCGLVEIGILIGCFPSRFVAACCH